MDISQVELLVDQYTKWFRSRIEIKHIEDTEFTEITTPFLDRDNDRIQLYVRSSENNRIRISDGGDTLSELDLIGVDIVHGKRHELIQAILLQNGVSTNQGELFITTTYEHFPIAKSNLIRAILAINDLYFLTPRTVSAAFKDDVEAFLKENRIRYSTDFGLMGKSGLYQPFHFLIQSAASEFVIQALGRPTRQWILLFIMAWNDVAPLRGPNAIGIGILNDLSGNVDQSVIGALESYSIRHHLWTKKESLLEMIRA